MSSSMSNEIRRLSEGLVTVLTSMRSFSCKKRETLNLVFEIKARTYPCECNGASSGQISEMNA